VATLEAAPSVPASVLGEDRRLPEAQPPDGDPGITSAQRIQRLGRLPSQPPREPPHLVYPASRDLLTDRQSPTRLPHQEGPIGPPNTSVKLEDGMEKSLIASKRIIRRTETSQKNLSMLFMTFLKSYHNPP